MDCNDENKRLHLQMIQDVISRMASNTFLIKGWSITALGAICVFWLKERIYNILFLTLGFIIFFWVHDAYYLRLERGFRSYYNKVRLKKGEEIDFQIKPVNLDKFRNVMFRPVLLFSYGTLLIINVILLLVNKT